MFLVYSRLRSPIRCMIGKYFLSFCEMSFHFLFSFWLYPMVCRILFPQPQIPNQGQNFLSPAWDTWSLTSGPPGESLFSLFWWYPLTHKLFSFEGVPFISFFFFFFGQLQFWCCVRELRSPRFIPVFSFKSFLVLALTFNYLIHLGQFCICFKIGVQTCLFVLGNLVVLALFLTKTIFPHWMVLVTPVENQLIFDTWVYFCYVASCVRKYFTFIEIAS